MLSNRQAIAGVAAHSKTAPITTAVCMRLTLTVYILIHYTTTDRLPKIGTARCDYRHMRRFAGSPETFQPQSLLVTRPVSKRSTFYPLIALALRLRRDFTS